MPGGGGRHQGTTWFPGRAGESRMNTPNVELLRLGNRIRHGRTALGQNQRTFAAACRLDRTDFGAVERGERDLAFSTLCAICGTLGCDVATLTAGIPALERPPQPRPG